MFEFRGIDLSTKYITPSTAHWLGMNRYDNEFLFYHVYDDGFLIWTYSADYSEIPDDLKKILEVAEDREWRFIVLDSDGADCDLFEDYSALWESSNDQRKPEVRRNAK